MGKATALLVALVAIAGFYLVEKHPAYEEHVAPFVQQHVTPLYEQHVAPLVDQHITPLYNEHVAPLVDQHAKPLYDEHVKPLYDKHVAPLFTRSLVAKDIQLEGDGSGLDRATCDALAVDHLTDVKPIEGFHVFCVQAVADNKLAGFIYTEGMKKASGGFAFNVDAKWNSFDDVVAKTVPRPPKTDIEIRFKQPWGLFTPTGERITSLSELQDPIVYYMEGGQFIWPGIRIGHKRVIENLHGLGSVEMETLEMTPLVFAIDEFLHDDEIDLILDLSMDHLAPSDVTHSDNDVGKPATEWRTSTTYFLPSHGHPKLEALDQRVADLVKVDESHQEHVQVLRYELNQKYDAHLDYFSIDQLTKSPDVVAGLDHGYKNRMITVFWYMSDVAKGGHTVFPRAGGKPQPRDFTDCTTGLLSPPKKRKVIVFYSMLPSGRGDVYSLHGGCPVLEGIKYSGNKWIWNKPFY
ncbi:hypothetical protein AeMF1_009871 [Aphanomyces euteiches]|nr:hypothetical protein AeMF1_009871 [Aphanomyces euteiches]KAH9187840.1 hypothetical protein AeNC1_010182 [Aphanomyces euteiches]